MTETPDLSNRDDYSYFEPVTLRYSDQDAMGHINNVAYAAFFEAGRLGYFQHLFTALGDARFDFVLAHLSIDYIREMHFPGTVQVGGRLLKIGKSSITTGYGAFLDGECYATSLSVNVYFDKETRRPRPFPDRFREEMSAYLT